MSTRTDAPSTLFLLFNHRITTEQAADAKASLGAAEIIEPPDAIRDLWKNVPPDESAIAGYLTPVKAWLAGRARSGDHLLVQGDFGATYIMVQFAFGIGMVPVYSTTQRIAAETHRRDGTVDLNHSFRHRRFRRYEKPV